MSHYTVLVIGDDIEKQLQPFHEFETTGINDEFVKDVDITAEVLEQMERSEQEDKLTDALEWYGLDGRIVDDEQKVDREGDHKYGYAVVFNGQLVKAVNRTNPNAKWDWWRVGGRWTGFFKLKTGADGSRGEPCVMTPQARKGDIDFDAMRQAAEIEARRKYRVAHEVIAGRPIPDWTEIRERHGEGNIEAARMEYREDPVYADLCQCREFSFWDDFTKFAVTEDEFAQAARDKTISTFAVLKDGQWHERGEIGWFAIVSNEKEEGAWNREFGALLDGLPDDTLLTVVDCHI